MSPTLPSVPVNASRDKQAAYLRSPEISEFLTTYYSHHRFVCDARFKTMVTTSQGLKESDSHYPDLNASLMLPALKMRPGTTEIQGLRLFKVVARCLFGVGAFGTVLFFANNAVGWGLATLGVCGLVGLGFALGFRERLDNLTADVTNAMSPLTPQARTVLSKIVSCFDTEEDDVPKSVETYSDAVLYLSNLRKRLYQAVQERESAHKVKLAEIEATAQVAFAVS